MEVEDEGCRIDMKCESIPVEQLYAFVLFAVRHGPSWLLKRVVRIHTRHIAGFSFINEQ